ncbi:DUF6683 family protein [Leptolyngbya sp. AN03gr2]|uniref:DUF6683 family protein n=1 Tax=unclassified Leptolyngbya TaxID=2650499 RepID=UPI003D314312
MRRYYPYILAIAALSTMPLRAIALEEYGGGWGPSLDTTLSIGRDIIHDSMMREMLREQVEGSSLSSSPTRSSTPAQTSPRKTPQSASPASQRQPANLTFKPSMEVRRRNFAQFVARARAADPVAAGQLEQLFASRNIIAEIDRAIAPLGAKTNNVADTMALYVIAAWHGARGNIAKPTPKEFQSVRNQMANILTSLPTVATLTDAQKQEMAEGLLIEALLVDQAMHFAAKDPSQLASMKTAISRAAEKYGFNVMQLNLTDQGLTLARS